jgi:Flp pilus assembly protein TadG
MRKRREAGAAMVELALLLPLLVLLMLGTVNFGLILYGYTKVDKAVHAAARYAAMRTYSLRGSDAAAYRNAVINVLNNGLSAGGSSLLPGVTVSGVTVTMNPGAGTRPRTVTVSVGSMTVNGAVWPVAGGAVALSNKPSATFPFHGRFVPASLP